MFVWYCCTLQYKCNKLETTLMQWRQTLNEQEVHEIVIRVRAQSYNIMEFKSVCSQTKSRTLTHTIRQCLYCCCIHGIYNCPMQLLFVILSSTPGSEPESKRWEASLQRFTLSICNPVEIWHWLPAICHLRTSIYTVRHLPHVGNNSVGSREMYYICT